MLRRAGARRGTGRSTAPNTPGGPRPPTSKGALAQIVAGVRAQAQEGARSMLGTLPPDPTPHDPSGGTREQLSGPPQG